MNAWQIPFVLDKCILSLAFRAGTRHHIFGGGEQRRTLAAVVTTPAEKDEDDA